MLLTLMLIVSLGAAGQDRPPEQEGSKAPLSLNPLTGEAYRPPTPTPPTPPPPPPGPPKPPKVTQFELAVQMLKPGGKPQAVDPARTVFRSGDRIQLRLASPSSGYAAVAQIGSDGTASLLFPATEPGLGNARIERGRTVILPSKDGFFEFDDQAGTETLAVLISAEATPIDDLIRNFDRAKLDAWMAGPTSREGSKNLRTVMVNDALELTHPDGGSIAHVLKLRHE